MFFLLGMSAWAADKAPPGADKPWAPPALKGYQDELGRLSAREKSERRQSPVDAKHLYTLPELIDMAERNNPETRTAWERARQTAAAVGLSQSLYYPYLAASAGSGYERAFIPFPQLKVDGEQIAREITQALPAITANPKAALAQIGKKGVELSGVSIDGGGTLTTDAVATQAVLSVKWLLLDFGGRGAAVAASRERLMMANVGFNAAHQKLVFEVTRRYYALSDARQKVAVGNASAQAARTVEQAASARVAHGLATKPELLQAEQQSAQAAFELEAALGAESDAEVALVETLGISPTTLIHIADMTRQAVPPAPERSVDAMIDAALSQRPELVAKLANLRAKEAEVRQARADFFPKVVVDAHVGQARLDVSVAGSSYFGGDQTIYGAAIAIEVPIFDGFMRRQKLRMAEADMRAAESELAGARDGVVREVWKAHVDFKTALRKQAAAAKLLAAADSAYSAVLESYRHGLSTYVEIVNAQRNQATAQAVVSETRAAIFTSAAALALSVGDLAKPTLLPIPIRK